MEQMDAAVERITRAISGNEHMVIFGDYDVDGTDSTAMLWRFLKDIEHTLIILFPIGLKMVMVFLLQASTIYATWVQLFLIAVDCGITAVQQVEYARSQGIDTVICDHHEPGSEIPNASAVLDTLKPSCLYPFKFLCGCGVAFKLIQALTLSDPIRSQLGEDAPKRLLDYLQYVTLATTADIVPLVNENRIMVKLGLELINSIPVPGIRALIETSGLSSSKISSGQIVFVLAPRINAVGRIGDANRAVEMLASNSFDRAVQIAKVMEDENFQRRKIDEETFIQAQEIVERSLNINNDSAIVLHQETWHPGVIGIVASRLVERTIVPRS